MATAAGRVIITGASSGLGHALARHYAAAGWTVGATARRDELLDRLVTETHGHVHTAVADVTDFASLDAAIGELVERLGGIDLLIANAGIAEPSGGVDVNRDGVERMVMVNVMGVVNSFAAVIPAMLAAGSGHVVAVGSMAGYKGLPGSAGYSATKAAVRTYCEGLRIELEPRGVAVTCVCPGFVATPMTAAKSHPMPWRMDAETAAARIARGLQSRPGVYDFPRRMRWLMRVAALLPDGVVRRRVPVEVRPAGR